MAVLVSPGIQTREIDFSDYAPAMSTSRFGMVGTATRGPVDTATLITDMGSLVDTFGPPSGTHYGLYAAERYLRAGRQLWFVRVAGDYYASSEIASVKAGGGSLTITANTPGTWGDNVTVVLGSGTDAGTYKITVQYNGFPVEVYDLVRVGTASASHDNYIETRINGLSNYISVTDAGVGAALTAGTVTLTGGDNGTPVTDADVVGAYGTPPTVPSTGLHCFDNPDTIQIDIVAAPGFVSDTIITALITLASTTRKDCLALIDAPYGLSVSGVVAWHNGTSGLAGAPTAAIDSSYAMLTYSWVQVFDSYNNTDVWIPPSGHVAYAIANTDYVANPWSAPAGMTRAVFNDIKAVEHSATQGERDYMYANGNAVNPICKPFYNAPFCLWGQRTLSRSATALDRVNVRRMLLSLRQVVVYVARNLIMEPNDRFTWSRFVRMVKPTMEEYKNRRAVYDFRIICDATTNTAAVIARNEMRAKILLKPTKTAEIISIDFILLPTGATFEEISQAN